ncbi:hypothetical protein FJY63_03395 [Candidatus Sumerlaeota bacterium]|nr:hypothetical protein [Candidatus Sumerlaeota bacterium]
MERISFETLTVFVILIPGFISSVLLNTFVVRKEKDTFSKITEALVFSFAIYAAVALFVREGPVSLVAEKVGEITKYSIQCNPRVVGWVLALSVIVPFIGGFLFTTDLHMALLRKLRITGKTARETVWLDVFSDQKRFVIVNLKSGRRVFGWPMYYSNTPEEGMLYLQQPAWIDADQQYVDLDIHGLFLVKGEIEYIEFTHVTADNASPKEEATYG